MSALKTRPDIRVEANGAWMYRDQTINNPGILNYFKAELRRDEDGYYIENRFGESREHGHLEAAHGLPVQAVAIEPYMSPAQEMRLWVRLDYGAELDLPGSALLILGEGCLAVMMENRGFPARLSGGAMASLVTYLHTDGEEHYYLVMPHQKGRNKLALSRAPIERYLQKDAPDIQAASAPPGA